MAANFSFTAFLKEMGVNLDKPQVESIDTKSLEKLHNEFEDLSLVMDRLGKSVASSKSNLNKLYEQENKATNVAEAQKIRAKILKEENELLKKKGSLNEAEGRAADFIKKAAATNKIDPSKLDAQLRGFNSYNNALTAGPEKFSKISNLTNGFFKGFTGSVGGMFGNISGILGKITNPIGLLTAAAELAGAQVVELNDKLIQFTRDNNGVFSPESIGYDKYGNSSNVAKASLDQQAGRAGINVEQVLATYSAFKQGSGTIGGVDLQNSSEDLQQYGIQIGKMNKMYGVSAEVSGKVATVLTQQYGKSIKETGTILEEGARTAKSAGVNVGIFFDNLSAIANLKGTLFVRGGADGLEKAALSLAKMGLAADKLAKLQDAYSGFTDLVDKQQKAVAMGFNNLAAVQNKIFAKIQTGDTKGALELKQIAGAQDAAQFVNKSGQINQQGIQALKSQGYDAEEIAAIERVTKSSKELGISLEQVVMRNNLTIEQRRKLDKADQEQLTVKEKLNKMWASIKAVVVDPIAAVIAPIFDIVIDTVSFIFDAIYTIMKPMIAITKGIGTILGAVWDVIKRVVVSIGKIFGFGDKGGNKVNPWEAVANVIGKVFTVISNVIGFVGDILEAIFDVLGKFLAPIYSALEGIWDSIIKYIWEPLKSLWSSFENLGKWLRKAWYALPFTGDNPDEKKNIEKQSISSSYKETNTTLDTLANFNPILKLISKTNEILFKIYDNTDPEQDVKISSIPSVVNEIPEIAKIMQAKTIDTKLQEQSQKENLINAQVKPNLSVSIRTDPHILGGVKASISGG